MKKILSLVLLLSSSLAFSADFSTKLKLGPAHVTAGASFEEVRCSSLLINGLIAGSKAYSQLDGNATRKQKGLALASVTAQVVVADKLDQEAAKYLENIPVIGGKTNYLRQLIISGAIAYGVDAVKTKLSKVATPAQ